MYNVVLEVSMNILVVDDSKMVRRVLSNMVFDYFEKKRWIEPHLLQAEDGLVAMQHLEDHKIDIMFLDWNMPNMNGEEVVDSVRSNKNLNKTRIIMATTEGSKANVVKMVKKGVNAYIVKPFIQKSVFKKLDMVTSRINRCSI